MNSETAAAKMETMWIEASEVRAGDRIARRNTCGGFIEWRPVTARHVDPCVCFDTAGGGFTVAIPDERIEIASDRT